MLFSTFRLKQEMGSSDIKERLGPTNTFIFCEFILWLLFHFGPFCLQFKKLYVYLLTIVIKSWNTCQFFLPSNFLN